MQSQARSEPSFVWYVSYGSNLYQHRLMYYLRGGQPEGSIRLLPPCKDPSPPRESRAVTLPHRLFFAGESRTWTGGMGFISRRPTTQMHVKARAYLVTLEQFHHIAGQESWRDKPVEIDFSTLKRRGHMTIGSGDGFYDELVHCGEMEGVPMLTFTSPHEPREFACPTPTYLRMIAAGLKEAHATNDMQISQYLSRAPGVKGNYTLEDLRAISAKC